MARCYLTKHYIYLYLSSTNVYIQKEKRQFVYYKFDWVRICFSFYRLVINAATYKACKAIPNMCFSTNTI